MGAVGSGLSHHSVGAVGLPIYKRFRLQQLHLHLHMHLDGHGLCIYCLVTLKI